MNKLINKNLWLSLQKSVFFL